MPSALRGRLMVGRLTLDQVVGVRVPAPQLEEKPRVSGAFVLLARIARTRSARRFLTDF